MFYKLNEVSGQLHATGGLPRWKNSLVPIELEGGWAPEPARTLCKKETCFFLSSNAVCTYVVSYSRN